MAISSIGAWQGEVSMRVLGRKSWFFLFFLPCLLAPLSCAIGGGSAQESFMKNAQQGSEPVNPREEIEYKQALIRCHKIGGSRIVKIQGTLRCY